MKVTPFRIFVHLWLQCDCGFEGSLGEFKPFDTNIRPDDNYMSTYACGPITCPECGKHKEDSIFLNEIKYSDNLDKKDALKSLEKVGSIPLDDPVHPHLSMPMDKIKEIQEAYKYVEKYIKEMS